MTVYVCEYLSCMRKIAEELFLHVIDIWELFTLAMSCYLSRRHVCAWEIVLFQIEIKSGLYCFYCLYLNQISAISLLFWLGLEEFEIMLTQLS